MYPPWKKLPSQRLRVDDTFRYHHSRWTAVTPLPHLARGAMRSSHRGVSGSRCPASPWSPAPWRPSANSLVDVLGFFWGDETRRFPGVWYPHIRVFPKNSGTPKSSIWIGVGIPSILGYPVFGNIHMSTDPTFSRLREKGNLDQLKFNICPRKLTIDWLENPPWMSRCNFLLF